MVKLRAVRPGEPGRRPLTVSQAAKDGTRRDLLVALRIRSARAVEDPGTPAPALAALSRRLWRSLRILRRWTLRVVAMLSAMLQQPLTRSGLFPEPAGPAPTTRRNDLGF
jgi:hypothetical protein